MAKQDSLAWTWRHAIAQSTLQSTTRHVLLTISLHMNEFGRGCYPTTKQLAEETGLSERAVITQIQRAVDAGWLSVFVHGFKGRRWKNHEYRPIWPGRTQRPDDNEALNEVQQLEAEGAERASVPQTVRGTERGSVRKCEGTEPDDNEALNEVQCSIPVILPEEDSLSETSSDARLKSKPKRNAYPDAFEAFWHDYPRTPNMSKSKALAGWKKLTDAERRDCHRAVPLYRDFLASKRDHPVMHASTFINERRFEGFLEQEAPPPPKVLTDDDWRKRLTFGRTNRKWHVERWGPFPGVDGCKVPEHLLQSDDGQGWAVWEA